MQALNWNDLRYLLAIARRNRLGEAARFLSVDDTTVTRRLSALQAATGRRLYQRLSDGRLELTEAGNAMLAIAERTEGDIASLEPARSDTDPVSGVVRLTSVPFIVDRVLAPSAGGLLERHRNLHIELVSDARDLSLTRRETDMALRLARPRAGGLRVKARRIGDLPYAPYASAAHRKKAASSLPWITYEEAMAHLPQARWMRAAIRKEAGRAAQLRVNDIEAAFEAVAAGYGRSMLPCPVAGRDSRLRRMAPAKGARNPLRELWLLVHAELSDLPRTRAVTQWIEEVFSTKAKVDRGQK